ncbi:MAG TPA: crosslink repair DNA glycosylase YcaQ family protein [Solirubrobacteraceae bacterium]|nr:crosslink repair DNA glycosylase YcaQ family protein [Solirubrobacteraceae bacterium]
MIRGPVVGRDHAFALVRDWLPDVGPPPARETALAELARRYLAGHGPATERDLARWAGLPLRDARAGLRAVGKNLRERPDGRLELAGRRRVPALPRPVCSARSSPC